MDSHSPLAIEVPQHASALTLMAASEQCFDASILISGIDAHESLRAHLIWNSIRLILCHDCITYLAGVPDQDAESHDIAMHLYRNTGDDKYANIARDLLPFDGLGKILVDFKKGRIKPHSSSQVGDLIEIRNRLLAIGSRQYHLPITS